MSEQLVKDAKELAADIWMNGLELQKAKDVVEILQDLCNEIERLKSKELIKQ